MKNASQTKTALRDFVGLFLLVITPMVAVAIPLDLIAPVSKVLAITIGIAILGSGLALAHCLSPKLLKSRTENGPTLAEFTI